MRSSTYSLFETPLGPCGIAWRGDGGDKQRPVVSAFQLPDATAAHMEQQCGARPADAIPHAIATLIEKIRGHLAGDCADFSGVDVDVDGAGAFAREVYAAARAIPAGQTRSYGEMARALARPGAARAVGQALGKNPIPLIIPCHRVLAAGGKPGGFSAPGGLATKARMLAIEGVLLAPPPTLKSSADLRRAAARLKARDSRLARCLSGPVRFEPNSGHSPYAALFSAVVHQQLTPKAASTILERVKARFAQNAIPEPAELLDTPDQALRAAGLSRAKTAALKDLARKALDGTVPTAGEIAILDDEEILRRLTSIRGVGRWTVEMLLIFNLGRTDVLPADDYALRKSVAEVYGMADIPSPKQLQTLGEAWRPHRTAAALYLWHFVNVPQ